MTYKKHYQYFLQQHPQTLHCSPHSHHYWPDVTRQAQLDYWEDSAKGADHKWDIIFGERIPAVQQHLARLLEHPAPEQFVFAQNTHELLYRVMTCFDPQQPLRILTTDGEFHSFSRQLRRLQERPNVEVVRIACEPYQSFPERWQAAVREDCYELVFTSQVFFNSGVVAPPIKDWLHMLSESTLVMVDGYHGCGALPTSLRSVADRVFYLAGSYKYLQAGEGCCFMTVPRNCELRPEYTGWFADFANLEKPQQGEVGYAGDGLRFAGATMDFTALYRLQAVLDWWQRDGINVEQVHAYVQQLQARFLQVIDELEHPLLNRGALLADRLDHHGHFLTFELDTPAQAAELAAVLRQAGIETDVRGRRLRFGFALYHDASDYEQLKKAFVVG
ncbi:aminotransferase class V-fold PLP-dependent enzyme [Pseudidiomarina sp. 1ASP75-14]|uniref:aminotransferase class V-fold PLP-dependent enzyme n=1 Tax=Pseudidiomarina terrestris TaxID=2820060 RepID=UPI00264A7822|nr:aminotransferase class V-fold PLP-dependent enzyme [Pseudidiomarina sp. 1ASP75-14]MDN7137052.1 aminotransferase class V-fold PLP-dependent enzyme [Pseudidiomarina sp. 1ASP75-14]